MYTLRTSTVLVFLALTACSADGRNGGKFDNNPPLSDLAPLYDGWPGNSKLADEGKADEIYPVRFDEPMQWQSPIKSQGSRGVCSIFSAIGLMEHLYIKEGTLTDPDFSEQFLQWSVKVELGRFADTEGSNSNYNLQALSRFGTVEEDLYPYQTQPWGPSDDEACTGDDRPVRCYTNGDPPDSVRDGQRWHIPSGRWISSRPDSIKAHMTRTGEGVVVGGKFFYQSWNHGSSDLPVDRDLFRQGFVTYPNDADQDQADEKPAGHSFVLVGWDDELETQARDGEGNPVTDAEGNPVMETGFFLFRNSWGAGSFGSENPYGGGYGWISMDYVQDYLTAYVSGLPELDLGEVCGDQIDNDFDGQFDCDDSDCAGDGACEAGSTLIHSFDGPVDIPDNDADGLLLDLDVQQDGAIQSLKVDVDITHSYQGDLEVALVRDDEIVVLHDHSGGGQDDLKKTFVVPDLVGFDASGTYSLLVADTAAQDTGRVNSWSVEITTGGESNLDVFSSSEVVSIPDDDPTGAFTNIDVSGPGAIASMKAVVDIDHSYKGDLTVSLQRIGAPGEVVLVAADASSGSFGTQSFVVGDFIGEDAAGTWRLVVVDEAAGDVGKLTGWSLEIAR